MNLGHLFALRPRVTTSFPAEALRSAKHALEGEGYATISDAARAVAEKALELTRDGRGGRGTSKKSKRR